MFSMAAGVVSGAPMAPGSSGYRTGGGQAPSLRCCVWELTLRCNLRCRHCGATAGRARADELSTGEALHVADELAALPADEVTLMGGELFLRPDWYAVAERLRAGGVGLVVFTNGTLLDAERIAQLRALEPRTIGTSLDGGCAAVHDDIRGRAGAFARTLAALDTLQAAGLRVAVITTLTRRNLYELPAIARLLAGRGIRWQIQCAGAGGERLARQDLLTPLEFYFAACFIARMRAAYPWEVLPVIGAHDFGYCSARLPYLGMPGERWAGCPAGRTVLGIQSDGRVKACLSLPDDWVVGSLREMPLDELWNGETLAAWRRPAGRAGFCVTCPHGAVCEGGCTGMALTYTGRRGDNPCCLYRLEQMHEQGGHDANQGTPSAFADTARAAGTFATAGAPGGDRPPARV
jgi:radical SAM protein with 4Fe4S-binding SPASM domain